MSEPHEKFACPRITALLPNPVKAKLARGEASYGIIVIEFFTPGLCQIAASAGLEFLIFDTEHSGIGIETIKQQIAYARGTGIVPMVRVAACERHLVTTMLDAGAMGIMVPMVESGEQARKLSSWCRYAPEGTRGLAFGVSHDDCTEGDPLEKMRAENARTLVIPIIETVKGIENIEEILAVPGVDIAWLGDLDITASYGITNDFDAPAYKQARDRFLGAAKRHGKIIGGVSMSSQTHQTVLDQGFCCLLVGNDVQVFKGGLKGRIPG
jgi:2-keto-3-deoxy-L-rhamnonate aldolase RhmA